MERQMIMVRIYLSEADQGKKHNLLDEVMELLHDKHRVHGVTVFRGIAGFGAKGVVRSADLLRLAQRLPLVVEFFDEPKPWWKRRSRPWMACCRPVMSYPGR